MSVDITPRRNPVLLGHDDAVRQVESAFLANRLHHAWLLTGPDGIGKTTLAFHIAHYVLSNGQNPMGALTMEHPAARRIVAEAHPDLFVLQRAVNADTGAIKDTIPVEAARRIAPFLHLTPTYAGWRVAILDEAHALNRNGQNAILKMVEEPPARALIIMTATTQGGLLPTIRSRCRALALKPLERAPFQAVMRHLGLEATEAALDRVFALSGGSPGQAAALLQGDVLPLYEAMTDLCKALPALDIARLHDFADMVGRKGEEAAFHHLSRLLISGLSAAIRDRAAARRSGVAIDLPPALIAHPDRAIALWEQVGETLSMARHANLDRKLAWINVFQAMQAASC